jgi:hypothetical protein
LCVSPEKWVFSSKKRFYEETFTESSARYLIKNPSNMLNIDIATDSQVRGSFPRAVSMSEDQSVMTSPPTKPMGNTGLLSILNHRKDTRKEISTQP